MTRKIISEEDFVSRLGNMAAQGIKNVGDKALRKVGHSGADGRVKQTAAANFLIKKWNAFCDGRKKFGVGAANGEQFDKMHPTADTLSAFLKSTFNIRMNPDAIRATVAGQAGDVQGVSDNDPQKAAKVKAATAATANESAILRRLVSEAIGLAEDEPEAQPAAQEAQAPTKPQKALPLHMIFGRLAIALQDAGLMKVGDDDGVSSAKMGDPKADPAKGDTSGYTLQKDATISEDGHYINVDGMRDTLQKFGIDGAKMDRVKKRSMAGGIKGLFQFIHDGDSDAEDGALVAQIAYAALTSISQSKEKFVPAKANVTESGKTINFGAFRKSLEDAGVTGDKLMKLRKDISDEFKRAAADPQATKSTAAATAVKGLVTDKDSSDTKIVLAVVNALFHSMGEVASDKTTEQPEGEQKVA